MATEPTDIELTPVSLDLMLRHAVEDSPDYDDGIGGWVSGRYESETGILTLRYERDSEMRPEFVAESEDYQHATTEYRFKLIPEIAG
jgi:hypothetical protein